MVSAQSVPHWLVEAEFVVETTTFWNHDHKRLFAERASWGEFKKNCTKDRGSLANPMYDPVYDIKHRLF